VQLIGVDAGQVAFVELALPPGISLTDAHIVAARARRAAQRAYADLVDVFVQTTAAGD
jgi:divalent metal cation (Fe/Co/Zn/Cd) transporter